MEITAETLDKALQMAAFTPEVPLLPLVVQDHVSGKVLMLGYVNPEALKSTLNSGEVTFFSRSKGRIWKKGESSGNVLQLRSLWLDCDSDTFLAMAHPVGPTCHRGTITCFDPLETKTHQETTNLLGAKNQGARGVSVGPKLAQLADLQQVLSENLARANQLALAGEGEMAKVDEGSYSTKLLKAPLDRVIRKSAEENAEWVCALKNHQHAPTAESKKELVGETCDVLFHLLVLLQKSGVSLEECMDELQCRVGHRRPQDGTVEKV